MTWKNWLVLVGALATLLALLVMSVVFGQEQTPASVVQQVQDAGKRGEERGGRVWEFKGRMEEWLRGFGRGLRRGWEEEKEERQKPQAPLEKPPAPSKKKPDFPETEKTRGTEI